MATRVERIVRLDAPAERLEPRLTDWAKSSGFSCIERGAARWAFRRGSAWRAMFSWDIEVLPTRAEVEVVGEGPLTVRASMQVDFGNRMSTAAQNEAEVEPHLRRMVAYLRGVYDFLTAVDTGWKSGERHRDVTQTADELDRVAGPDAQRA